MAFNLTLPPSKVSLVLVLPRPLGPLRTRMLKKEKLGSILVGEAVCGPDIGGKAV